MSLRPLPPLPRWSSSPTWASASRGEAAIAELTDLGLLGGGDEHLAALLRPESATAALSSVFADRIAGALGRCPAIADAHFPSAVDLEGCSRS